MSVLGLLILTGWLFGYRLGRLGFWNKHSESRRAEVSREMVVNGDWIVPRLNGQVFATKPPLGYWLMAASFRWTGRVDEWAARLPSALCGWLTVLATYIIGRRLWGHTAGLLSAAFLATGALFQWYARSAGLDMPLTCLTTLTLLGFIVSHVVPRRGQVGWGLFIGVALGLATLTKGPIGLSIPLLPMVGWLAIAKWTWSSREPFPGPPNSLPRAEPALSRACPEPPDSAREKLRRRGGGWRRGVWMALAFLVMVIPWGVMILERVPDAARIALQEVQWNIMGLPMQPGQRGSSHPWYSYLATLAAFVPWSFFLPAAGGQFLMALRARRQHPVDSGLLFVWLWFGVNLIAFSLAPQKKHYYFLPCLPAVALLIGHSWTKWLSALPLWRRGTGVSLTAGLRWNRLMVFIPLWLLIALFLIAGLAFAIFSHRVFPPADALSATVGGILLIGGGFSAVWCLRRQRWSVVAVHLVALTCVLHLVGIAAVLPLDDQYRSRKPFVRAVAAIVQQEPVYAYRYGGYDAPFYLQRIVPFLDSEEALQAMLSRKERVFVILPEEAYLNLRQISSPNIPMTIALDQTWRAPLGFHGRQRLLLVTNQ